ncbi:MAG TPA: malectin domain-containing carbohydrate-binding protein [Terracidiphilus sp.]|nr:malectin domain-containing carbohydrate-binding protein [Terracidiphilus sp.]
MKYRILAYLTVLLSLPAATMAQSTLPPGTWNLVLDDEFTNDSTINTQMWQIGPRHSVAILDGNCAIMRTANSTLSSSSGLSSITDSNSGSGYTADGSHYSFGVGYVQSTQPYSMTYGYMEILAQFPDQMYGAWPTFWAESYDSYPPELDIAEYRGQGDGNFVDAAYLNMNNQWNSGGAWHQTYDTNGFLAQWHAWGVDVEPGSVDYYLDGQRISGTTIATPDNVPLFAILDGGMDCGKANGTGMPGYFNAQYFRWYQHPATAAPSAPVVLTAHPTSNAISLSWPAPAGSPTGYYVQRATTSGGPYTTIKTLNGAVPGSYTDTSASSGTAYYYVVSAYNNKGQGPASHEAVAFTTPPMVIGTNVGGSAISGTGWTGDTGFSGGTIAPPSSASIYTDNTVDPAPQGVYQTNRYGSSMTYTASGLTPGGQYHVRLHFAETYYDSTNSRVFNVSINGTQVLNNYDINFESTGKDVAAVEEFNTAANSSGNIVIQFTAVTDHAQINGIEIDPAQPPAMAIRAGGGAISGTNWIADAYVSGGQTSSVTSTIDTSRVVNPAPQSVYQKQRYGNMTYTLNGLQLNAYYRVRLHFAETYWNCTGCRVFNVTINGATVLNNFDIFAAAGGKNIADAEEFIAQASGYGNITIQFAGVTDHAAINGVEIDQAPEMTVLTINSGGSAVSGDTTWGNDNKGGGKKTAWGGPYVTGTTTWLADTDYTGGASANTSSSINTGNVVQAAPSAVYQSNRYANSGALSYTIPGLQAGAQYLVRLHFAENYYSSAGARVFNVTINGVQVLTNFDMYAASGGKDIAIVKEFPINADSSGKITINTTSLADHAQINAIEIDQ